MTVSCVSLQSIPSFKRSLHIFFADIGAFISSKPIQSPFPLTSFIKVKSRALSSFKKYNPRLWLLSIKLSSYKRSRALEATAAASGLPPNVDPCDPGSK